MSFAIGRRVSLGLAPILLFASLASPNAAPQGPDSRIAEANAKKTSSDRNSSDRNSSDRNSSDKGTRYRFVNLNKVLEGWSKAKKTQEEFVQEFDRRTDALRVRAADLQKKQQELQNMQLAGATDEAKKRLRDFTLASNEFKFDQDQLKNDQKERRLRILLSSYQQIQDVVAKWASKNDVDAVFVIQEEDAADADLMGKYERALVRQVLWYSKDLDISEEIVKLLEVAAPAPMTTPNAAPSSSSTASKPAGTTGNK
jgi:Skp family chaperone for outer membrane proteins